MDSKNSLFELVCGEDIFKVNDEDRMPLIEGIIYKKDYVLFVAEQKTGKTVCLQNMAMCLSSGTNFLGVFDIPKPIKVLYIATEGKINDIKDRFIRMRKKIKCDTNNLMLIKSRCKFNNPNAEEEINGLFKQT